VRIALTGPRLEPPPLPWLLNRISFSAAIIAVSVLVHLGFVGAIVFAERRHLPPSELRSIDVDLVKPEELEPKTDEPARPPEQPKQADKQPEPARPPEPKKAEPAKTEPQLSRPAKSAKAAPSQPSEADEPPPEQKPAKPDTPQGGPAGEGKSKLTPEEIASLRSQIQKCWKLPVGIPGVMGLEVVLRVQFGSKGQLAGEPVLLQAPAHERGPLLVGIALSALKGCYPFQLPAAKYADWKSLDLKFTATGMAGIAPVPKLPKPAKG
jgi:hypothetical protein